MLQPNFFAWHIRTPDEQILLAVGGDLWHYDVELETATRRDIPRDSPFSPLAILGGDTAQLRRHYEVLALGKGLWQLKPRFESADFSAIVLEFSAGLPGRMEITDLLERTTEISFADVERNPGLSASDFSFEPPPGVDIYDHE
jgi:outer membrane lipoprotein carrier protein